MFLCINARTLAFGYRGVTMGGGGMKISEIELHILWSALSVLHRNLDIKLLSNQQFKMNLRVGVWLYSVVLAIIVLAIICYCRINAPDEQMEDLFDLLQRLLSPSVVNRKAWSHRRLLRYMQRETRIKSCTNDFDVPRVCQCREDSPRYRRRLTSPKWWAKLSERSWAE